MPISRIGLDRKRTFLDWLFFHLSLRLLTNHRPRDAARIDVNQEHEVRYWTEELGVDEHWLRAAVAEVGPMLEEVRQHLDLIR